MCMDIWNKKCILSPSLICLDMLRLEDQIRQLDSQRRKNVIIEVVKMVLKINEPYRINGSEIQKNLCLYINCVIIRL